MKGIKRFRRLGGALLAVSMLCSVLAPGAVLADWGDPAVDGAALTVVPESQAVETGDTVTVTIEVSSLVETSGAQTEIAYDDTVLSFVSATAGDAFDGASGTVTPLGFPPTASGGVVSNAGFAVLGGSNPAGTGTLMTLEFTAIASGVSPITIQNGSVAQGASPLPLEVYNGSVGVDMPDLIVSEKRENWIDQGTGEYDIEFKVQNIGNGPAGATETEVYVDTVMVADAIPVPALAAGAESAWISVNAAGYGTQILSGQSDDIEVVADAPNDVAEGDETNNSLTNTHSQYTAKLSVSNPSPVSAGTPFDVVVEIEVPGESRGAQSAFSFDPMYVECTGITVGDFFSSQAAGLGATASWFGNTLPTLDIDNTNGTVSNIGCALIGGSGGATGTGTFITYHMIGIQTGTSPLDIVNAEVSDAAGAPLSGVVAEDGSVDVTGGLRPTVEVLSKSEEWVTVGETYTVTYTIVNNGAGAAGSSSTGILIDGVEAHVEPCPALPSGTQQTFTVGPFTISGDSDEICVVSDYYDEVPNQKGDRIKEKCNVFGGQPDLVISDKFEDWDVVGYSYFVTVTTTNDGTIASPASTTSVAVDGTEVATISVPALAVGASDTQQVGPFTMTGDGDVISVTADSLSEVAESDETNNVRENVVSVYGDGCYTELYANIAPEITITCPMHKLDWLLHVGDNSYSGVLNVKSNTSWQCDVSDENPITDGHMTKWDGFSYDTSKKLNNPMIVECVSEGTSVELAGPGKIADGDTSGQNGNLGENFDIDFNQAVDWVDGVLVDGSAYRIVVSFNASVNV